MPKCSVLPAPSATTTRGLPASSASAASWQGFGGTKRRWAAPTTAASAATHAKGFDPTASSTTTRSDPASVSGVTEALGWVSIGVWAVIRGSSPIVQDTGGSTSPMAPGPSGLWPGVATGVCERSAVTISTDRNSSSRRTGSTESPCRRRASWNALSRIRTPRSHVRATSCSTTAAAS